MSPPVSLWAGPCAVRGVANRVGTSSGVVPPTSGGSGADGSGDAGTDAWLVPFAVAAMPASGVIPPPGAL